jgi:hypothetical protein
MRWYRRLFRRRAPAPALDLAPLDRLAELVGGVVRLLEELAREHELRAAHAALPPPAHAQRPSATTAPDPPLTPAGRRAPGRTPGSAPEPPEAVPAPPEAPPAREPEQPRLRAVETGTHVLFVGGPQGYRLLDCDGPVPGQGEHVDLDGVGHGVLRLGPSPLPADRRRCAFVEQEHLPRAAAGAAA